MPRQDWHHDDALMSRERDHRGFEDLDRGAMFDRGDRGDRGGRSDREQGHGRMGGWGSLLEDESGREFSVRDPRRESIDRERRERGRERHFGPDDERSGIPRDETERLIASNKVEGTPVYDRNGERLGSIHNFMVDKFRGRVVYAVLKHGGGFLGLDERYYPLDWDQLTYDSRLGGYHIDMVEEQLKERGSWDKNQRWQGRSGGMRPERGGFDRERESGGNRDPEFDTGPDYARGSMRDRW